MKNSELFTALFLEKLNQFASSFKKLKLQKKIRSLGVDEGISWNDEAHGVSLWRFKYNSSR